MNRQVDDEFEDRPEFPHPSDTILKSLLDSFFRKEEAPDLRSRIHSCVSKTSVASPRCTAEDYDEAVRMATTDFANGYGLVMPPPIERIGVDAELESDDYTPWLRRGMYLVAALAAAVVMALLLPGSVKTWVQPENTKPAGTDLVTDAPAPSSGTSATGTSATGTSAIEKKEPENEASLASISPADGSPAEQHRENTVESQNGDPRESIAVQFETAEDSNTPSRVSNLANRGADVEAMSHREIVGVIDSQLSFLWDRVGLTTTQAIQTDAWLDRAASAIVGRPATNAEKQVFHSGKNEDRIASYVDNLISSSEFSRFWSQRLGEHYLGRKLPPTRDLSGAEYAFLEWLEDSIAQKVFLGEIEQQLIDGPSKTSSPIVRDPTRPRCGSSKSWRKPTTTSRDIRPTGSTG